MDFATYLTISAKELQERFRTYPAIVVSGRPTRLKCDAASLEEWGGLDEMRVMHGNIPLFVIVPYLMFARQFSI